MNEQEERMLGDSLRRAIETQAVRETPFVRSKIADELARPRSRPFGFMQFAMAAAALVLLVGVGALVANRGIVPPAASPTPSPDQTVAPTASPTAQPTRLGGKVSREVVYFSRDQLPPVAEPIGPVLGHDAAARIKVRLEALATARPSRSGLSTAFPIRATVADVKVEGDLAKVDYTASGGDWGISGSARVLALQQQIVYTASEEPGIRRVLITQNGGQQAVIGGEGLVVDKELTREDVFGYPARGSTDELRTEGQGSTVTTTFDENVEQAIPGVTRIRIGTFSSGDTRPFTASVRQNDERTDPDRAKWVLSFDLPGARGSTANMDQVAPNVYVQAINQTPLRAVYLVQGANSARYEFALDDLRPWRVVWLANGTELAVDIGGYPGAVSQGSIGTAIYSPRPGAAVTRSFTVTGVASAYEATVQWRVKNAAGAVVAQSFTTATIGTSPAAGEFRFQVGLPASVSGSVTLEMYQADQSGSGRELHLARVPLVIQ